MNYKYFFTFFLVFMIIQYILLVTERDYYLLYDTLIVGGGCMALTQYILYHYYDILKRYRPILLVGYLCTMFYFFYTAYKYNPDLSNLKGVVLF